MSTTKSTRTRTKYKVSEEDYNRVKDFQKLGIKATKAAALLPYSYAVLNRIYRFDTWTEYQDFLADQRARYAAPKTQLNLAIAEIEAEQAPHLFEFSEPVGEPVEEPYHYVEPILPITNPQVEELSRIANALERLADAWEASPKKKFF